MTHGVMPRRWLSAAALLIGALATPAVAQQAATNGAAAAEPTGPGVGDVAPDITLAAASRYGVLRDPVRLSDYRGSTVVLAFFPKARTKGCTAQMEAYRDQYATLFNNGRGVVVLAVSVDADTTLAAWAREKDFPVLFGSDPGSKIGQLYGTANAKSGMENRNLFVIGPDGRVAHVARPFNVLSAKAYQELGAVVDSLAPPADDEP